MFKKFGIKTLALAAVLAAAAPAVTFAHDRDDDDRGGVYRQSWRQKDRHGRDGNRDGWNYGMGYAAPSSQAYYGPSRNTQYGNRQPYGSYSNGYGGYSNRTSDSRR